MSTKVIKIPYKPGIKQQQFHDSSARFRGCVAGTRGGKTVAGANEAIKLSAGSYKQFNHGKIFDGSPTFGWCIAESYPVLRDVVIKEIFKWLPKELIKDWRKMENNLILKNGSVIGFRSADDPDRLRGVGLDWVWIDEARNIRKAAYDVLYTRLTDKRGVMWATTTPNSYDWVYQVFYKRATDESDAAYDPINYNCIHWKTIENEYIDPTMIEAAKLELTPEYFRQEYEATFEYFTGRVYKDFFREKHVIDQVPVVNHLGNKAITDKQFEIPEGWLVFRTLDFGTTNPFVCLWIAVDYDETIYIFDEYYQPNKTTYEHSETIKKKSKDMKICATYGDVTAAQEIMDLGRYNIPVIAKKVEVISGINRVAERLKEHPIKHKPRLMVFKGCTNTIREFESYRWSDSKEGLNEAENPVKKDDHCMDALKYFICNYFAPKKRLTSIEEKIKALNATNRFSVSKITGY